MNLVKVFIQMETLLSWIYLGYENAYNSMRLKVLECLLDFTDIFI